MYRVYWKDVIISKAGHHTEYFFPWSQWRHRTGRCGNIWWRPISRSGCLLADMMMMESMFSSRKQGDKGICLRDYVCGNADMFPVKPV